MPASTTTTPPPPPRQNITYHIPSSTITLDIILNESKPLPSSSILTSLSGAAAVANTHDPASLVEGVFTYHVPQKDIGVELGVVGTVIVNELTWGDVVVVLQGLEEFMRADEDGEGRWVGSLWYLMDEKRGVLGDGYLEPGGVGEGA